MLWSGLVVLALLDSSLAVPLRGDGGRSHNKLLLVSFDGFRWDYDQDVDTPNLDAMAKEGVKAKYVTPPFITITSPSHFTLLTGKFIENHGVIHNMWFNTTTGEKKPYYASQFVNDWWDNGSLPIWITAQRQGLKTGSFHFPGTAATYQGETTYVKVVEPRFYDYSNEEDWHLNINKVMEWFVHRDLDFVSLYFGEPDSTGHKFGPNSEERKVMVRQVDRTVGYLRDKVKQHGLDNHLNIILTADHGMNQVQKKPPNKIIVLSRIANFSLQDLQFSLFDYGPVSLLLPKEGRLEKVYNILKNGHPNLHVYKKEEIPSRLRYSQNPRILPLLLFADPGYVIHGIMPVQFNNGEHGFDNDAMDMKTFFRAVGPDFKANLEVDPFHTVNVYALMCNLLGIKPEANDGSLEVTQHMLREKEPEKISTEKMVSIALLAVACVLLVVAVALIIKTVVHRRKQSERMSDKLSLDKIQHELNPVIENMYLQDSKSTKMPEFQLTSNQQNPEKNASAKEGHFTGF
ncbi:ectonucleotide pyrophosphatase/phosphodiesterase family member 7-like [Polypterus senegalus]|uniref:ectonucleotide pyrophosphatase/phosphodiesterase family member 7-like n=1 Tax=Polypterus senegalus TaxID=55291 RepID=UPI001963796F|nr:ectonucleotide pyrophosphatase/phosphodiesterase family member 7-like [Polypterus senegalus]